MASFQAGKPRSDSAASAIDPGTAPPDLLDWLAGWVGIEVAPGLPDARRRQLVATAARLHMWRGTPFAISTIVELTTGYPPEIIESGGTTWSREPEAPLPGRQEPGLVVPMRTASSQIEESRLMSLIAAFMPAHVPWRLELLPE